MPLGGHPELHSLVSYARSVSPPQRRVVAPKSAPSFEPPAPTTKPIKSCLVSKRSASVSTRPMEEQPPKATPAAITAAPQKDRPALHKKTVAFGKTVNVSQTVEAQKPMETKKADLSISRSRKAESEAFEALVKQMEEMKTEMQTLREEKAQMKEDMQQLTTQMETLTKAVDGLNSAVKVLQAGSSKKVDKENAENSLVLDSSSLPALQKELDEDPLFKRRLERLLGKSGGSNNSFTRKERELRARDTSRSTMREQVTVTREVRVPTDSPLLSVATTRFLNRNYNQKRNSDPPPRRRANETFSIDDEPFESEMYTVRMPSDDEYGNTRNVPRRARADRTAKSSPENFDGGNPETTYFVSDEEDDYRRHPPNRNRRYLDRH